MKKKSMLTAETPVKVEKEPYTERRLHDTNESRYFSPILNSQKWPLMRQSGKNLTLKGEIGLKYGLEVRKCFYFLDLLSFR